MRRLVGFVALVVLLGIAAWADAQEKKILVSSSRAELVEEAERTGATIGPIHRPSEFVEHRQSRARHSFLELDGDLMAAAPFTLDGDRPALRSGANRIPDWSETSSWFPTASAARATPILEGMMVVEFGVAAVGPECSWILSELGAEVIKIESAARPDVLRLRGGGNPNASYTYNTECRGRRSNDGHAVDWRATMSG